MPQRLPCQSCDKGKSNLITAKEGSSFVYAKPELTATFICFCMQILLMSEQLPVMAAFVIIMFLGLMYITQSITNTGKEGISTGVGKSEKLTGQEAISAKGNAEFSCAESNGKYTVTMDASLNLQYTHEGKLTIKPIAETDIEAYAAIVANPAAIAYDSKALEEAEKKSLEGVKISASFGIQTPYDTRQMGRITFWRDTPCMNIYIAEKPAINVNEIIDRCPESYLGSFSFTDNIGCGRILAVKTDPADSTEVWIYTLTGDLKYDADEVKFALDNYERTGATTPECIVASTNEGGGDDLGSVWYIQPGGIVRKTGDMRSGLANKISKFDCGKIQDNCATTPRGDFVICGNAATCSNQYAGPEPSISGEKSVGEAPYTNAEKDQHCTDVKCNLLEKNAANKWIWQPKYELLCSDKGVWEACNVKGSAVSAGGKIYTCGATGEWS